MGQEAGEPLPARALAAGPYDDVDGRQLADDTLPKRRQILFHLHLLHRTSIAPESIPFPAVGVYTGIHIVAERRQLPVRDR